MAFRGIQSTNIISTDVGLTDPLLILNKDGSTAVDVGFLGKIGATSYAGLVKDSATDGFILVGSITLSPNTVNDVSALEASLVKGDLTAGAITATSFTGDGSALTGISTVDWTQASAGTIHASNYTDTDTTYSVGDGGLTEINFTSADNTKLDAIDTLTLLPLAGGTMTGNLSFGDNNQIRLGASNDLAIYHDGNNSVINEEGNGTLLIQSNGSGVNIQKGTSEIMAVFRTDSSVDLYHNNVVKLETTATGVTVAGTVGATAFTGDGSALTGISAVDWTQASAGTIHASNYTDTDTTYTAGTGLTLTGTTFSMTDPIVSSVDDADVDSAGGGNQTIVVTGSNFTAGGVISFVGSSASFDAATTTYNSATQVTAIAPKSSFLNAQEPYAVKFTSISGRTGQSSGVIYVDNAPTWSTTAGNVADVIESAAITNVQLTATDPEGDAVTYSETTSNLSGAGLSLSSAGVISGTTGAVGSHTTTSFDVRATAGSKTTDRTFNVITRNLTTSALLWDATSVGNWDFSESTDGPGLVDQAGGAITGVTTAVTISNVDGASGTLANMNLKSDSTRMYTHYNIPNMKNFGNTFWSTSIHGHTVGNNSGWWGIYQGSGEAKIWTTYDAGANPTFKFRRLTGEWTWRSGSMVFTIYGTNNISAVNDGATFSNTNLTSLFTVTNHTAQTFDTGYWTGDFYRYYVFHLTGTGGYDWGLDACKWYGDYY